MGINSLTEPIVRALDALTPPHWMPATRRVIAGIGIVSVLGWLLSASYMHGSPALLLLFAPTLTQPWAWFTACFFQGYSFWSLLTPLMIFNFGSQVERQIGSRAFVYLFVGSGVVGHLAASLLGPFPGASLGLGGAFGLSAIFGTFCYLHASSQVSLIFLTVNAWRFFVFMLVFNLLGIVFWGPSSFILAAQLLATAAGMTYVGHLRGDRFGWARAVWTDLSGWVSGVRQRAAGPGGTERAGHLVLLQGRRGPDDDVPPQDPPPLYRIH